LNSTMENHQTEKHMKKRSAKQIKAAARIDDIYQSHPLRDDYPRPEEEQTFLIDLLCDLEHWAEVQNLDFEDALDSSNMHYETEKDPDYVE